MTLATLLAAVHDGADLGILFLILALIAFGAAIYCAVRNLWAAAAACALVGVVILVVT